MGLFCVIVRWPTIGATQGWGAKCARVQRYFQLRRQAASRGLSAAEAAALHGLVLDQRALEWWFRMMQTASDVGFLTPQQLCALGATTTPHCTYRDECAPLGQL